MHTAFIPQILVLGGYMSQGLWGRITGKVTRVTGSTRRMLKARDLGLRKRPALRLKIPHYGAMLCRGVLDPFGMTGSFEAVAEGECVSPVFRPSDTRCLESYGMIGTVGFGSRLW